MHRYLYAVLDIVAQDLGPIVSFKADAQAVRMFTDLLTRGESTVAQHPEDFDLICLGMVAEPGDEHEHHRVIDAYRVVLSGKTWLLTQEREAQPQLVKEA